MSLNENTANDSFPVATFYNIRLTKYKSNMFIVSGAVTFDGVSPNYVYNFSMGSQLIKHPMFVGLFNNNGQLIWKKENSINNGAISYRPIVDKKNNIYFSVGTTHGDGFGNYIFINHYNNLTSKALLGFLKLDSLGNVLLGKNSGAIRAGSTSCCIYVSDKIYLSGSYTNIIWDSTYLQTPINGGTDVFMVSFDTANYSVVKVDSLKSSLGYSESISAMVADKKGNIYIGGYFEGDISINGTTINNSGGDTDFFIAKYGSSNCGSVMPLRLLTFTGKRENNTNLLQWTTAQEINVSHFEVERSYNGTLFSKTGRVKANPPLGGTGGQYSYTDNSLSTTLNSKPQTIFYRLKMVDKDGQYTYSNIAVIKLSSTKGISIYPNPAKELLNVSSDHIVQLTLTDNTGRNVLTRKCGSSGFETINVARLASGIYVLRVKDVQGNERIEKVVVE